MQITLSERVQNVKPSATLSINARAAELKAQGQDLISLSVGEPDFDTPEHIKQAATQAMRDGLTRYTAVDGIPSLKQAIIAKFLRDNQLHYELDQVIVSSGAKQSLYNFFQAYLNPGDEVIVPAPYWVSYPDMVLLADGVPKAISTTRQQSFKITPEQLANSITPKTKALVLNSPSNPTGVAYSKSELIALAEILLKHPQIIVISDDIYEHIYWGDETYCNIINACPDIYPQTLVINGVSKAYAMTGWRIGYAAGHSDIIKAMKKIQSQSTSNPCSIAQIAAQAALESDQHFIAEMAQIFQHRHQSVLTQLNAIPGIETVAAQGAFYLFPDIQDLLKQTGITSDLEFAEHLLNKAGVAIVPGTAFGSPGHFRLSFAASTNTLDEALLRIKEAVSR